MEIGAPSYKGIKRYQDGDNAALRKVILNVTPKAAEQMCQFAERFRGKDDLETCRNIWNFLKNKIKYVADQEYQIVRLPSALLKTKEGDCKSYSVFTSAILQCLGIPHHYMMTSYNKANPTPSHIYVMTDSGIIIDAVWHSFNSEKPYAYVYKIKPYKTMKTNTGLGGTAIPPFKVGMGAIPSFQGRGSAIPMISNVGMGGNCGCGCGGNCGMGAVTKKQVNAPLRTLLILFFKYNIGGLATKLQEQGIGDDRLGRWFTELGGDGRELWAAIKEGSSKPAIAKWFSNSIKNATIRRLRKKSKKSQGGIGDVEPAPQSQTTEETNNTEYQQIEDILAVVMQGDSQVIMKTLFTTLGAAVVQLIPPCAADPTGAVKAACGVGGGAVGFALAAIYPVIVKALFPKKFAGSGGWDYVKRQADYALSLKGKTIPVFEDDPTTQTMKQTGTRPATDADIDSSLATAYYNAGRISREMQSKLVAYIKPTGYGKNIVSAFEEGTKLGSEPLEVPTDTGKPLQAGAGIAIAAVGVIALLTLSASRKGIKGRR